MSADHNRELEPGRDRWARSQQSAHWREIGISAVAAAARYSTVGTPATTLPAPKTPNTPTAGTAADGSATPAVAPKVVTLKDIEFFAA